MYDSWVWYELTHTNKKKINILVISTFSLGAGIAQFKKIYQCITNVKTKSELDCPRQNKIIKLIYERGGGRRRRWGEGRLWKKGGEGGIRRVGFYFWGDPTLHEEKGEEKLEEGDNSRMKISIND